MSGSLRNVAGKESGEKINAFNVNVCSENPERLIAFYADVVGLPRMPQLPG